MIKRTWYALMLDKNDKEYGCGGWDLDVVIDCLRIFQKSYNDAYIAIYSIAYSDPECGISHGATRIGEYHLSPINV